MKLSYPYVLISIIAIVIFIVLTAGFLYMVNNYIHYAVYDKKRRDTCVDPEKFCDMKIVSDLKLPEELKNKIIKIASDPKVGKRVNVYNQKAGRTLRRQEIQKYFPELLEYYKTVLTPRVSAEIGETVYDMEGFSPLSTIVLVYDNENDFINWHYDVNVYEGRFFTVLFPLTGHTTCTQFQYINRDHKEDSKQLVPGEAVLFEGDMLYHRATKQCKMESRIAVAFEFVTVKKESGWKKLVNKFKQAFFL